MKLGRLCTTVLLFSFALSAAAEEDDPRQLIQRAIETLPDASLQATVELSSSRGWSRTFEISGKRVDESVASFIEVTGPQDVKDTRFLFFERVNAPDEQHMYIPLVKRAIQIADETRKQAFLGSDFFISDLVAPEVDAYTYKYVGEDEILGRKCRLVESVPKDLESAVYSKSVACVDANDLIVLRTELFDKKGNLLKVWTMKKIEKVDGFWTPFEQEMANVQDKTTSTIIIQRIEYNVELPDDTFSRARLLR
jgi:outer membrane lipoprotein-sorting protein